MRCEHCDAKVIWTDLKPFNNNQSFTNKCRACGKVTEFHKTKAAEQQANRIGNLRDGLPVTRQRSK